MNSISKNTVKVTTIPKSANARRQDGGFGWEFAIWFAALITLALNGEHIAASFNLGDNTQEQTYEDLAALFSRDFFVTHEIYTYLSSIESYQDAAQYLISENWVSSDTDAA